jgi:imidazolonepropionase-like amidohydrolase
MTFRRMFLVFAVLAFSSHLDARETSTLFRGVTIVDVISGTTIPDSAIVIRGNRIVSIGPSSKVRTPRNARVIDARGKFVIPGLWDMHVHLFSNRDAAGTDNREAYFPHFIAHGVTGVRDAWSDPDDVQIVRRWRNEMAAGRMVGPRIVAASSIFDGVPVVHRNARGVASAEEARRAVREEAASGAEYIKVYELLSREAFFAIADEAKKLRIPFAGHVPSSVTVAEASGAGQKSIEHSTGMLVACSSKEEKFAGLAQRAWTPELRAELLDSFDEAKCRRAGAMLLRNGTFLDPTHVVNRSQLLGDDDAHASDPRLDDIAPEQRAAWMAMAEKLRAASRTRRELRFQRLLEVTRAMHAAGVPMLAGTDLGNEFLYAGSSLHDELALFVRAGLTPLDALRTATINPARYLGRERELGSVSKGKLADLVFLDANPLVSIEHTRSIFAVVLNGRYVSRAELDAGPRATIAGLGAARNHNITEPSLEPMDRTTPSLPLCSAAVCRNLPRHLAE